MPDVYIPIAVQREVIRLSNDYCEYCWYPAAFSPSSFHFDHIIALSKGGNLLSETLHGFVAVVMAINKINHITLTRLHINYALYFIQDNNSGKTISNGVTKIC